MPLIAPVLDDRSFEDIFAELRNRIPVYTPEWTDHQDSDVGITLLQLFAFLGEGLQFRFNQIPEATQLAFLKLLGLPLRPARPAQALLRFDSKLANGIALYGGDQVRAGKTAFTLTEDASVWPLDCVAVARRSLLSEEELARPGRLREFVDALDPELRVALQGSIDAVGLAAGSDTAVAPYETLTLASDGSPAPLDFTATVDGCVWLAVLAAKELKVAVGDLGDPVLGLKRVAGRPLSLSVGFSPQAVFPELDAALVCAAQGGPSMVWQASLAAPKADGSANYAPLRVAADTTQGFSREGVVRLELPADLAGFGVPAAPAGLAGSGSFPPELDDDRADRLWFWLRAWRSDGSRIGTVRLLALNAANCEQRVAAAPQLLGTGTGQPDPVWRLASAPVLVDADPVRLQVEEGGQWTDWTMVDTLDASTASDRHFTVDAEAGTLRFGLRHPQLGERIRVTGYSVGGGAVGNVPPGAIDKLGDTLAGPVPPEPLRRPAQAGSALQCTNPFAARGGVDSESIDEGLRRIPAELRRNHRAVARDDFASLALQTPGLALGRADCLPLFHAPSRSRKPGCVSVVVWPSRDMQHPGAPRPDAWELAQVCSWLDRWRLVTTELYIIPPTYRRIALALSVKVRDGYGLDAVRDWVEQLLRQYLAALPPQGPEGAGWPLGRRVNARELEAAAMQVEGLEFIETFRLDAASDAADGSQTWAEVGNGLLALADWELPELAAVTVVDDSTALPAPGSGLAPPPVRPPVPVPVLKDEC